MKAELILSGRRPVGEEAFVELVIWRVPEPVKGSIHSYKYRLAYVVRDICVLRHDNEAGKGDHRHFDGREEAYVFTTVDALLGDFWADVGRGQP